VGGYFAVSTSNIKDVLVASQIQSRYDLHGPFVLSRGAFLVVCGVPSVHSSIAIVRYESFLLFEFNQGGEEIVVRRLDAQIPGVLANSTI